MLVSAHQRSAKVRLTVSHGSVGNYFGPLKRFERDKILLHATAATTILAGAHSLGLMTCLVSTRDS